MAVWCTQNMCGDSSSFTWNQPCNNQIVLYVHHLSRYKKMCCRNGVTHLESHATYMQLVCSRAEKSANMHTHAHTHIHAHTFGQVKMTFVFGVS